jgi:elongation factor Ts
MSTAEAVKIDAKLVKELREKSGAPMGDCLKALQEAKGDMEDAFVVLRKRGMASAAKKASRTTNEGAVGTYIHAGGKIGVLIELNCESDFVARTDDFQELLKDIAMHIAAVDPRYVSKDEVTEADLEREKDIYRSQAIASGKPAAIVEKMLVGKLSKFYEEFCLLEQPFIKESSLTIGQLIRRSPSSARIFPCAGLRGSRSAIRAIRLPQRRFLRRRKHRHNRGPGERILLAGVVLARTSPRTPEPRRQPGLFLYWSYS